MLDIERMLCLGGLLRLEILAHRPVLLKPRRQARICLNSIGPRAEISSLRSPPWDSNSVKRLSICNNLPRVRQGLRLVRHELSLRDAQKEKAHGTRQAQHASKNNNHQHHFISSKLLTCKSK